MGKLTDGYKVDGAWHCMFGLAFVLFAGIRSDLLGVLAIPLLIAGIALAIIGVRKTWRVSAAWKLGDTAVVLGVIIGIAGVCASL